MRQTAQGQCQWMRVEAQERVIWSMVMFSVATRGIDRFADVDTVRGEIT